MFLRDAGFKVNTRSILNFVDFGDTDYSLTNTIRIAYTMKQVANIVIVTIVMTRRARVTT